MVNELEKYNINSLKKLSDELWHEYCNRENQHGFFQQIGLHESCDIVFDIVIELGDDVYKCQRRIRELQFTEEPRMSKQTIKNHYSFQSYHELWNIDFR